MDYAFFQPSEIPGDDARSHELPSPPSDALIYKMYAIWAAFFLSPFNSEAGASFLLCYQNMVVVLSRAESSMIPLFRGNYYSLFISLLSEVRWTP